MKTVILHGDSIREGYQPFVTAELAGEMAVFGTEHGRSSRYTLEHLNEGIATWPSADVVHLNCGLHDLASPKDQPGKHQIEPDEYEQNLRQILSTIRDRTSAKIIWARTTPTNEKRHHEIKPFDRLEADVVRYNEVGDKVASELADDVNDLYTLVMEAGRDELLGPDGCHFTDEGKQHLARAVVDAIRRALA